MAYYPVRPGRGVFHGTKIKFNYSNGYQEPSLEDQFYSLYNTLLGQPGGEAAIQQFHVPQIGAEELRAYDGGGDQSFANQRGVIRITYFHNQFRNQVESVPVTEALIRPQRNLDARFHEIAPESLLDQRCGIALNPHGPFFREIPRAEVEFTLLHNLFLRAGCHPPRRPAASSFTSDLPSPLFNTGPPGGPVPPFANVPIGASAPLRGARPFRRPPHTGFAGVSYGSKTWTAQLAVSYSSRSDDSTFLAGEDLWGGNSLLLPNRNLDYGYTKIDLGGSYQVLPALAIYAQLNNLTSAISTSVP